MRLVSHQMIFRSLSIHFPMSTKGARLQYLLKTIQEKLAKLEVEKKFFKKEIDRLKPELQRVKSLIVKRTEDIDKLEKRINEIVDRIYKNFSRSVGVKNIREYEENQLKAAQEMYERKLSLSNQMSKLKYQILGD